MSYSTLTTICLLASRKSSSNPKVDTKQGGQSSSQASTHTVNPIPPKKAEQNTKKSDNKEAKERIMRSGPSWLW